MKNCLYCDKEFKPESPNQHFCCEQCRKSNLLEIRRKRYKNPLPKITNCLQCGKLLEGHYKKFCSIQCIVEHRKDFRRKTERRCNPVIKPEKLNKCKMCGEDIPWIHDRASSYNKKKFCSKKCCAKYFKLNKNIFHGKQIKIGEFKIIINKYNNNFIWQAYKNNKEILKSTFDFKNYIDCLKDAKIAFM